MNQSMLELPLNISKQIGKISFQFNTSCFQKNGTELVKSKELLKKGVLYDLISIQEDVAELAGNLFVKNLKHTKANITLGVLEVVGENVHSCSRNGVILRRLPVGYKLLVKSIIHSGMNIFIYQINELEFISSDEVVEFYPYK